MHQTAKRPRPRRHKESAEQVALIRWAHAYRVPEPPDPESARVSDYLIAIPNGGYRNAKEAARLKAEGVKAGVSDLFLALPRGNYAGLWVELKPSDGSGRLQNTQAAWASRMNMAGYLAIVAVGWLEAKRAIMLYLDESRNIYAWTSGNETA